MNKKKKKKKSNSPLYYWALGLFLFGMIRGLIAYFNEDSKTNRSMQKEGYTTDTVGDPFYKKITTNNTLDDYYDSVQKKMDNQYEEYYLKKDSYSFIELKMTYNKGASTVLNISSDLRDLKTTFNYEYSYLKKYLLMEGNSTNNYDCKVISRKNMTTEEATDYCDQIQIEISIFSERRANILENERVQSLLQDAPPIVETNNEEN